MGARKFTGDGGTEYWGFPQKPKTRADKPKPKLEASKPLRTWTLSRWVQVAIAIVAFAAGIVAVLDFFGISGADVIPDVNDEPTGRDIFGGE